MMMMTMIAISLFSSLLLQTIFGRLLLSIVSEMRQIQTTIATDFQLDVSSNESSSASNADRIQLVSHTLFLKCLPKLSETLEDALVIVAGPCLADHSDAHDPGEAQDYSQVLHRTVRAFYDELEVSLSHFPVAVRRYLHIYIYTQALVCLSISNIRRRFSTLEQDAHGLVFSTHVDLAQKAPETETHLAGKSPIEKSFLSHSFHAY